MTYVLPVILWFLGHKLPLLRAVPAVHNEVDTVCILIGVTGLLLGLIIGLLWNRGK